MIILPVERKTWRARIVLSILYLFLSLGAITMVWPFLMMISGSVAGRFDYHRYSPVVRALWDEDDRFMLSRVVPVMLPGYDGQYYAHADAASIRYVYRIHRDALMDDLIRKLL